jgi:inorganic pyrophosphatase
MLPKRACRKTMFPAESRLEGRLPGYLGYMSPRLNATHYEAIPAYPDKHARKLNLVHAVVETPMGSRHKYALNNELGIIAYHDILPDDLHWPFDYGFVPHTLASDGDPLDILIVNPNGYFSGCLIAVRVVGVVRERKDGVENDRLIAVPTPSAGAPQLTDRYLDISDVPRKTIDTIVAFLRAYSECQGHTIELRGLRNAALGMKLVRKTARAFDKRKR